MFGQIRHTIDEKGRLTIPAHFRPELAQGAIVTKGFDPCLTLYPIPTWEALAQKVNALPITDRLARDFRRFVFGSASEVALDRQGRVLIPVYLREYAFLGGEATVVGNYTYLEIWNPERWQAARQGVEDSEKNTEYWARLQI